MQNVQELYGLLVLYNGLQKASKISSKPDQYLKDCAENLINPENSQFIEKGAKQLNLDSFQNKFGVNIEFNEKFMQVLEKHLINLEDEVSESYSSQLITTPKQKNRRKKCIFNPDVHKKSIIMDHIKSNNYIWPIQNSIDKLSYNNIFKRRPRQTI
jgi:hypothetical protein